jgi:ribosome maturation factor RimP
MGAEEEIAEALRPVVRAFGLDIWDVERSGASVRVLVERPGGVDLDAISEVSSAISALLDQRDDLVPAGRYMLEVSSPGLERRLRYPRHFASYVGQEIAVKAAEPVDGSRRLHGTLVGATDVDITIRVAIPKGGTQDVRLELASVERANTVFTWGPSTKAQTRTEAR